MQIDTTAHHTDESSAANRAQATKLAEWLRSVPADCYDCVPCTVLLGNMSFVGCSYKQDRQPLPGAPNQAPYTMEAIYCLGTAPKIHERKKICYHRSDDSREWYLASHTDSAGFQRLTAEQKVRFHPFGATFILSPWETPSGEKIDAYERKPYHRVDMAVIPFD